MTRPAINTVTPTVKTPTRQVVLSKGCDRITLRNRLAPSRNRARRSWTPLLRFIATLLLYINPPGQFGTPSRYTKPIEPPCSSTTWGPGGRFHGVSAHLEHRPDHPHMHRSGDVPSSVRWVTSPGEDGMFPKVIAVTRHRSRGHPLEERSPHRKPCVPGPTSEGMAMNSGTTISTELSLRLVVPDRTVPLLATVEYAADDPYALRVAFHVGNDEPVEWIFARELLILGMARMVGDGDVQVWPGPMDGNRLLNIGLSSPFGDALFEAPLAPLADFLHRTFDIVPPGRETEFVDIAAELDNLLWPS